MLFELCAGRAGACETGALELEGDAELVFVGDECSAETDALVSEDDVDGEIDCDESELISETDENEEAEETKFCSASPVSSDAHPAQIKANKNAIKTDKAFMKSLLHTYFIPV